MTKHRLVAAALAMILLLAGLLSSCGQPSETGPIASGYAPPQAVSGEHLSISYLYPGSGADERLSNSVDHLQRLLSGQGWNVTLALEGALVDEQSYRKLTVQTIRADITAGNAADGYIVSSPEAQELLNAGLTQDLTGILPTAAPALYSRCGQFFTGRIAGIPINIGGSSVEQTVFFLRKDLAGSSSASIDTISDVLAFLENNAAARIGARWSGIAYEGILSAWAAGQGYCPLEYFGLYGAELYASYSDPQCAPVPIEDIPGFDDFFIRGRRLWTGNRIVDFYSDRVYAKDIAGYVGYLRDTMDLGFLTRHERLGGDYVAFPLAGCIPPMPAQNEGERAAAVHSLLAVPTTSAKAEQLAAFAQWALTDRHNYDLVRYGDEGMDYRLVDDRVEYLNNGNALSPNDLDYDKSTAYFLYNPDIFTDSSMDRISAYAPENYQGLLASQEPLDRPLLGVLFGKDKEYADVSFLLRDVSIQYDEIISNRRDLLNALVKAPNGGTEPGEPADCLARLHAMAGDTGRIVDACTEKIALMMMERGAVK